MNHLIIFAHPSSKSFNHAIYTNYEAALKEKGDHVIVRDLYSLNFNPILTMEEYHASKQGNYYDDVKVEQNYIKNTDIITFIYPVWWAGLPAILKGYIDRVFSYGFAYELEYESPIKLLKNKKAVQICTTGTPKEVYKQKGILRSMNQTTDEEIFNFCGIEVIDHLYYGNVVEIEEGNRKQILEEIKEFAKNL
ncbi:NAD(P)H-dependent oxidoreductase [Bacillus taeanensis]|uniref:Flavodoxin family protein n=1 Tax=Bacillus taeanensis TaxID=273032 RepID=A0A366XYJ4_9BACI|nr:NAD(P)H-dependent oxidoreductase [Bacillus taeanensis]RBW69223.1 flavodoxin family protein [Bacillus taeanensis]